MYIYILSKFLSTIDQQETIAICSVAIKMDDVFLNKHTMECPELAHRSEETAKVRNKHKKDTNVSPLHIHLKDGLKLGAPRVKCKA